MSHPNQLALVAATERWIDQSQSLGDREAIDRLTIKINEVQDGIHEMSLAAAEDREPDQAFAGLSAIDMMSAQSKLVIERNVRLRFADLGLAA